MKLKTYVFFLLFVSAFSFAQTVEQLKVATKKIHEANYNMDFDSITKFSYPKIVAHYGKEKFLEKLDHDYQNETYRMRIQLEKVVFEYGSLRTIDGVNFCVVTFKNPARYFYETKLDSNTSLIQANFLREKDRTRDVTFEPKRNSFNVRRTSNLVAVADASTQNQWRFFNMDDPEQRALFDSIFNENIKNQLGL